MGEQLFEARVGAQDMPFQGFPNQRMDLTDNRQRRYQLRWQGTFGRLGLDGRLWHETVEHAMDFGDDKRFWYSMASMPPGVMGIGRACSPISPTCAAGMPMIAESRTNAARLAADWSLSPTNVLRVGGEAHAYRLDDYWPPSGGNMFPGTFVNINSGKRDRIGVFVDREGGTDAGWRHLLGLRVEDVDTDTGPVRG
jgi:iron complex outermembrane receptor protein